MISIDVRSRTPIYEQIIEAFKEQIIGGELKVDEKLPSVRELAGLLAINPNTIQRAMRKLEEEGFIYSIRGKGSFVMAMDEEIMNTQRQKILSDIQGLMQDAKQLGVKPEHLENLLGDVFKGGSKA